MSTLEVPLRGGRFALIDEEDRPRILGYRWRTRRDGNYIYAIGSLPGDSKNVVFMHRLIAEPPAGKIVDHKDRNGLNNTRSNLRICTVGENIVNCASFRVKGRKSRFKGVSLDKCGMWFARIRVNGKQINFGWSRSEEEAARAYDAKAREIHGEFAYQNFPAKAEGRV